MRRLFRVLVSRRVAVALMLAMAGVLGLATLVPEPDLVDPARLAELKRRRPVALAIATHLRPERVSRSPLFLVLPGLVFLSTAYSITVRVRAEVERRRRRTPGAPLRFRAARTREVAGSPAALLCPVRRALARQGFRPEGGAGDGDGRGSGEAGAGGATEGGTVTLAAARGDLGFAGSIAFHVGMLVVLVGVGVSALRRCSGDVLLAEGFPVTLGPATILHPTNPPALAGLHGATVGVRDFTADFSRGFDPTDYAAVFEAEGPGVPRQSQVVRVNEPVRVAGYQLTLHRYGFAPTIVARQGGRALVDGTVVLRIIPPGTPDGVPLANGDELRVALWPDHTRRGGASASRSLAPNNPVLEVRHLRGGAQVARGVVRRGDEATVGELLVAFPALHYWTQFLIVRDPGLWWITVGSALIALGLAVRFLCHPRRVHLALTPAAVGSRLDFTLSAQYFPALNDERADRLIDALAGAAAPAPGRDT